MSGRHPALAERDDAGLIAVLVDESNGGDPDPLVHAGAGGTHVLASESSTSNGDGLGLSGGGG